MNQCRNIYRTLSLPLALLVLVPLIFAAPALAASRGVQVVVSVKDKAGEQVALYKESHALVIGVSDYTGGWPRLPGVKRDVKAVTKALEQHGFSVVVVENPTLRELEDAFRDFILTHGLKLDNRLLFYFAGHGYTHKPSYAANDPEEWMGYIVSRGAPRPTDNFAPFLRHAMSMQRVNNMALQIEAKHALFLFDSCFSGSVFALSRAVPRDIAERTARPVRQFITSGSADQEVPDQSIFRREFVSALGGEADMNGDGYVTGSELGFYLEEKVTNYSRGAQTPQYGKIRHRRLDRGDFVFALPGAEEVKTAAEDVESAKQFQAKVERERKKLEAERKRLEAERRLMEVRLKLAEEKQQLQLAEEQRKLEAERKKLEAERRLMEERRKLAAEKQKLAEQRLQESRRKLEEEQKRTQVARLAPGKPPKAKLVPKETPKPILRKASPKGLKGPVKLTQFISAIAAEEYLERLEWTRYVGYKGFLSLDGPSGEVFTNEPVYIISLKDSGWNVEFLGHTLGHGEAQPVVGDAQRVAFNLLRWDLPKVYRAYIEGDESADLAIIFIPSRLFFDQIHELPGGLRQVTSGTSGDNLHFNVRGYGLVSVRFSSRASRAKPMAESKVSKAIIREALPIGIRKRVQMTQIISTRAAEEYLETIEWERYNAYQALVSREQWTDANGAIAVNELVDEPAIILVLKDAGWTIDFLDRTLGVGDSQPLKGNIKRAAQRLLKRELPNVYRVHIGEGKSHNVAIVLIPNMLIIRAASIGANNIGVNFVNLGEGEATYSVRFTR